MNVPNPFVLLGEQGYLAEMTRPYWLALLVAGAALGGSLFRRRIQANASVRPALVIRRPARRSSDSSRFLGVFVWGIQTSSRAIESMHWGHWTNAPVMPWKIQAIAASATTLCVLLLVGLAAESIARKRGLQARADAGSLPVPVIAAACSAFSVWCLTLAIFSWNR